MIGQDAGSIDPMAIDDENGQRWLIWKEDGNSRNLPTPIWAQRLTPDGLRLFGERHLLLKNDQPWEGALVEGGFIVRRGGWFYMFYAGNGCCGRACKYATGVARSRHLLGPWEKHPAGPILIGHSTWRCPGHGSVVDTPDGRLFFLYHAYRSGEDIFAGRQGMLDEVTFDRAGWPVINGGRGASTIARSPLGAPQQPLLAVEDDFTGPHLDAGWCWPFDREPGIRVQSGRLVLAPGRRSTGDWLAAVAARRLPTGDTVSRVVLEPPPPGVASGLAAYGDAKAAVALIVQNGRARVIRREKGVDQVRAETLVPAVPLELEMESRRGRFHRFRLRPVGASSWTPVGGLIEGGHLPPWDRAVRVALVTSVNAVFARFRLEPNVR